MKPSRLSIHCSSLYRTAGTHINASNPKLVNQAQSGKDNFIKDYEKSHIKTNTFQKILLGLGSGVISLTSPSRGDMIAVMGEVTGYQALESMRLKMSQSEEGKKILEEKPRISSGSIDIEKLKQYPDNTLGKAYSNFLGKYDYTPDTRNAVQFVDDIELAYVAQRYRETHDLIHTLLDMPTNMLGEVTVKWVEAIQFKLPMCVTGALFGAMRLAPKFARAYSTKPIVNLESSLQKKIESNDLKPRDHPGIMHIPRISLPDDIVETGKKILSCYDYKNIFREAEKLTVVLKSRVLPLDKEEIRRLYTELNEYYEQKFPPEDDEDELDERRRNMIQKKIATKLKTINKWKPMTFDERMALKYFVARAPAEYAVIKRVLNEIRKRDPNFAPTSLLDFGSGIGTVNWVAHEFWGDTITEYYCVDPSAHMHDLAALLLRNNDIDSKPIIKNVYYRQFFPATIRPFDIVVSAYTFFEMSSSEERLRILTALWNDTIEYLVLIENGTNWGFKVISEARDYLLNVCKDYNVDCHVFAPCPHDLRCPRLSAEGKKTPCNFYVHYKKFSFWKSDDSVKETFSFVIFRKSPKPPESERQCRLVRKSSKTRKLATCHLCTTKGELSTVFVTACKHGQSAYKVMRASNWGDLVPGKLEPKMIEAGNESSLISDSDSIGELVSGSESDSECEDSSESDYSSDSDTENNETKTSDRKNNFEHKK